MLTLAAMTPSWRIRTRGPLDGGPVRSVVLPIAFDLVLAGAIRTAMGWPDAVDPDADTLMSGVTASVDGRYTSYWFP